MKSKLIFADEAYEFLEHLAQDNSLATKLKSVRKALGYLETNPRHPGLRTHKYKSMKSDTNEELFIAYVENNTPGAYRIFWYYGPDKNTITIAAIRPHP